MTKKYSKAEILYFLEKTTETLSAQNDFSPENQVVNQVLGNLVSRLTSIQGTSQEKSIVQMVLKSSVSEKLPVLCACSEFEMESWWSKKIAASQNPKKEIKKFWYYTQYIELCKAELELIKNPSFNRIVFLGSGPLPMSAIILSQQVSKPILCIDQHAECNDLARHLTSSLGISNISFKIKQAQHFTPAVKDLIIYASLLHGKGIYDGAVKARAKQIIVRDAEGIYQLLYRAATLPPVNYKEVAKTAPCFSRINTSRLFHFTGGQNGGL